MFLTRRSTVTLEDIVSELYDVLLIIFDVKIIDGGFSYGRSVFEH